MQPKLLTREQFRDQVFARDGYKCVFCGKTAEQTPEGKLDAHHIIERRLYGNGGYYIDNGATVCEYHHLECERTAISVEDVRIACGITHIVVPDQFYPEQPIDKWGNYILEDGRRTRGELFYDESVQKVLGYGGILHDGGFLSLFTPYVKYGRTFHLPWSPGAHDDDKTLLDASQFYGQRVVITKKMDGENTSAYSDGHVHARSIDSKGGEDRAWVKQFLVNNVCFNLPEGWRVCGENMWAEHSISYDNLTSYFLGFSIWNELNVCLSWDETLEYFELLGITPVDVLYDGMYDDLLKPYKGPYGTYSSLLRYIESRLDFVRDEGYVIRLAGSFKYSEFKSSVAKFVRAGHVQTTKHWRAGRHFTPNKLMTK
jgi:RNA ligase